MRRAIPVTNAESLAVAMAAHDSWKGSFLTGFIGRTIDSVTGVPIYVGAITRSNNHCRLALHQKKAFDAFLAGYPEQRTTIIARLLEWYDRFRRGVIGDADKYREWRENADWLRQWRTGFKPGRYPPRIDNIGKFDSHCSELWLTLCSGRRSGYCDIVLSYVLEQVNLHRFDILINRCNILEQGSVTK